MFQYITTLIGSATVDPIFLMSPQGGDPLPTFLMFGAVAIVFYIFFIQRPQAKKAKEQKEFLSSLKKGDKLVTIGGIHGRLDKAEEEYYIVEIAPNTKVRFDKSVISIEMTKAATKSPAKKDPE